jgi:nucleoside-diphosphate-sugar epimerase
MDWSGHPAARRQCKLRSRSRARQRWPFETICFEPYWRSASTIGAAKGAGRSYMVVGNGLLAGAFAAYAENPDIVIFASGVSNSGEKAPAEFERERTLLMGTLDKCNKLLIYFSTCSIFDSSLKSSLYIKHKIEMEYLVRAQDQDHLILRLPQVVGITKNPHTITNFIRDRLVHGEKFTVWANASRTIVDVDDVRTLADHFIADPAFRNRAINIFPPVHTGAVELVRMMERILDRKGCYEVANIGSSVDLDEPDITQAAIACGIRFTPDYPEQVLRKYYG